MWRSFLGFFNTKDILSYQILEHNEPKDTNFIYRDNLSKNKKPKSGAICFASANPVQNSGEKVDYKKLQRVEVEGKGSSVIRVKVTMTKKEAARLLSKSKEGGVLGFKDVAHELVQIPVNRVSIVSATCLSSSPVVLQSIPE